MEKLLKKFFRSSIIISVILIALGLLLIFYSAETIKFISYVVGAIIIAIGTTAIIRFVQNMNDPLKNPFDIAYGIISIVLGILIITNPTAIASFIPIVLGIGIIISSAMKLQYALELRVSSNPLWKGTLIVSLVSIICGLVLIFNPFQAAEAFTMIMGILIIAYSILDICSSVVIRRNVIHIQNTIREGLNDKKLKETMMEAEIVEEKETEDEQDEPTEENQETDDTNNKKSNKKNKKGENYDE